MADTVPALPVSNQNTMVPSHGSQKNVIDTFIQSHAVKHIGRLIGLAVAVSIGVVVALWTSEPNYMPLYKNISSKDMSEVAQILDSNKIDYQLDPTTGMLLVEQAKSAEARMKLASQGLLKNDAIGLEMLQNDQGLGTSQFIENARYNHALEQELTRSIETIRSIESARVHLAMPKQSIFIRNRISSSASVVVKLYSGRELNSGQVSAIVSLVASSIPTLEAKMVTVVDQFGHLLSEDDESGIALTSKQFNYTQKIENNYSDRIIQLLEPIVGAGKVNTQVAAELDFAAIETTREAYDPERSVIRSEQVSESESRNSSQAIGIPGALSNQPSGSGTTNPIAETAENGAIPNNQNRSSTRNFEVDRVISHTQHSTGTIQRLSVAVVIDNKIVTKDDGTTSSEPYTDEEVERFNTLVKQAIGFSESRGDTVSVINTSFIKIESSVVEIPLWEELLSKGWLVDLVKQVFGALGLLIVYFMFGRPLLRTLNPNKVIVEGQSQDASNAAQYAMNNPMSVNAGGLPNGATVDASGQIIDAAGNVMPVDQAEQYKSLLDDPNNPANLIRRNNATYDQKIEMAKNLVMDDPARVANVMKTWVGAE